MKRAINLDGPQPERPRRAPKPPKIRNINDGRLGTLSMTLNFESSLQELLRRSAVNIEQTMRTALRNEAESIVATSRRRKKP